MTFRPFSGDVFIPEGSGLGTFRMTLNRSLHFHCVPNVAGHLSMTHLHWHKPTATLRCRAWSTIGQQNTRAAYELSSSRGFLGTRHSVLLENTHSSQMYSFHLSMPDPQTAGCPCVTSDLCPASLPSDLTESTARHTIWWVIVFGSTVGLSTRRHYCSPVEEPATYVAPVFPFAYHTNLTSISILRPSLYHASTLTFCKLTQHICKSQNSTRFRVLRLRLHSWTIYMAGLCRVSPFHQVSLMFP